MLLLSLLINSYYYHYHYYFTISFIYLLTYLSIYLLLPVSCYFTNIFCHLLDLSWVLSVRIIYIFIYLFMYLNIYLFFICLSLVCFFFFELCSVVIYKVFLQVVSPHMIFHCKYLAILFLLVYTETWKIM